MTASSCLDDDARRLVSRLGGRWTGQGGVCRCPAHADRTPSLSVRVGRRRLLLHCFAGCPSSEVLAQLIAARLLDRSAPVGADLPRESAGFSRTTEAGKQLWRAARPIDGTLAERYLVGRDIGLTSSALRFHPRTPFGAWPQTVHAPAMIAAACDETGLIAVHRTRLDIPCASKTAAPPRKAALGRLGAAAVRLAAAGPRLGLAEGIEDALSATALTGIPCWATLGAARFGRIALPRETRELVLFLDGDESGRRAEQLARRAFEGRLPIQARYPARAGTDWNDIWRSRAPDAPQSERGGSG